jgi:hypothetical protein
MFYIKLNKDEEYKFIKKNLKIPKGQSEAVNQRTGNTTTIRQNPQINEQVGGFLQVLRFPSPIKLTTTITEDLQDTNDAPT